MEVLPAIAVTGVCFAVSQFVVSNFVGPYLPDIMPRWSHHRLGVFSSSGSPHCLAFSGWAHRKGHLRFPGRK